MQVAVFEKKALDSFFSSSTFALSAYLDHQQTLMLSLHSILTFALLQLCHLFGFSPFELQLV